MNGTPARAAAGRMPRIVVVVASCACALALAENLWSAAQGQRLRGVEYLFAAICGGYLVVAATRRRWAAPLGLAGLSTLFATLAAECLCGPWGAVERNHAWYVWPPGYSCRTATKGLAGVAPRGRFTVNSLGLRGAEPRPDVPRILCVGGSTTECFYLDDDKSWPAVLERELASAGHPAQALNAGRSGLVAADHALLLEKLPEAKDADCWVVLCGVNDLGHQLRGLYADSVARSFERTFAYRRPGLAHAWRRPWQRNLLLVERLEQVRHRVKAAFRDADYQVVQDTEVIQDPEGQWIARERQRRMAAEKSAELPRLEPWLDEYERQLARIIALARASDKRLVLLTQPVLWQTPMPPELDELCLGGELLAGGRLSNELRAAAMAAYNQRMLEVARRERVECLDLASALPRTLESFYDDCHFNEPGARRVAQELSAHFVATGGVRTASGYPAATSPARR